MNAFPIWLEAIYFLVAALFIIGLKQMSSPVTARRGVLWAGAGMLTAGVATLVGLPTNNLVLMLVAIGLGSGAAWYTGRRVAMTAMPQMVALYNGMGGGAAACISALELLRPEAHGPAGITLAVLGGLIGAISFSGSLVAFAKLQGWFNRNFHFPAQQLLNFLVLGASLASGLCLCLASSPDPGLIALFFLLALTYGVLMTLPIGGADMPVVISLYNAGTGLAVGLEGFVLENAAMLVAGTVVGAAGTLLTRMMAKAMNRSITNVLFSRFGETGGPGSTTAEGEMKEIGANDAAAVMAYAESVIVVPGYGMAVAQAQHKLRELTRMLQQRGVKVRFAIHPVAGRMPGHMNVLLAEAGVSYEMIEDLEDINADFPTTDVALVIGANDVVNPEARENRSSPIYGMPILDVDRARNCIIIKRGRGRGFSGVDNTLFYAERSRLLFGDGQQALSRVIQELKNL